MAIPHQGNANPTTTIAAQGDETTMQVIRTAALPLEPATHENPHDPGCLKKVLIQRSYIRAGRLQMVNWAVLKPQRAFSAHYHEDMTEVFIIVSGRAEIRVDQERGILVEGDAVVIPPRAVHTMSALDGQTTHYIAMGVSHGEGGRTIVVPAGNQ